jgi:hypothetical protein
MLTTLAAIWLAALGAAFLGRAATRWRPAAGLLFTALLVAALAWHAAALASFPGAVLLIMPGATPVVVSLVLGYLVAFAATLAPLARRGPARS